MIQIQAVTKTYPNGKRANDAISLTIEPGEIFGLLGPNGAGKSTLLKVMTGIISASSGDVILNGKSITHEPLEAKRQFAFVSDSPDNFLRLRGIEYLNFIADMYDVSTEARTERLERLGAQLELSDVLGSPIQSYSHGMRQKIMVMGALVVNPPIWILDEPLIGLDPKSAFNLKVMIKEHAAQGNIVIFSTHVLEVAQNLVNRLAILDNGRLIFAGTLEDLRIQQQSSSSLEDLFLRLTASEEEKMAAEGKRHESA